jgi:hypothetical protein
MKLNEGFRITDVARECLTEIWAAIRVSASLGSSQGVALSCPSQQRPRQMVVYPKAVVPGGDAKL